MQEGRLKFQTASAKLRIIMYTVSNDDIKYYLFYFYRFISENSLSQLIFAVVQFCCLQSIFQQGSDGHGAHASGNRCDHRRAFFGCVKLYISA